MVTGVLVAALVGVSGSAAVASPTQQTEAVALIVGLRPGVAADAPADRLAATAGVEVTDDAPVEGTAAVTVDVPAGDVREAVVALRADPAVAYVELDRTARAAAVTANDPYRGSQWGLDVAGVATAWQRSTGSPTITVAVVDTGVNLVADLSGAVLPGHDFVNGDTNPADDNGHGTMTAGVLAARGNNGSATAGVCWSCTILPVKVLDADGYGSYSDIAAGIVWAADNGAHVINLSLGGSHDSQLLRDAVTHATGEGALVIAAAGNAGTTAEHYPAAVPAVLAVGASTATDGRYSWSSYGTDWVDIAAPGCNSAQDRAGTVKNFCGTSSATPFTAGVAALALAAAPGATASDVRAALTSTAATLSGGWVSSGRVDAGAALQALPASSAPTVTVARPTAGAYLRGAVTVTPTVSDDVAITRVEALVDGQPVAAATAVPWTLAFASGPFSGRVTLTAVAYDGDGYVATADVPVTIDNRAPTASFRSPGLGARLRGTVAVGINAADNTGVARVDLLVGGRVVSTDRAAPWITYWRSGRTIGGTTLTVRVYDRAGNATAIARRITADNTAPAVGYSGTPRNGAKQIRGTVTVKAKATDTYGISRVQLLVNGRVVGTDRHAPFAFKVKTWRYGKKLRVQLRAYDHVGNVRYTPIRTWYR
jgi:hypothetical protein